MEVKNMPKKLEKLNRTNLKKLNLKEDKNYPEYFIESKDRTRGGFARVYFENYGHRKGKLYWKEIRFIWNYYDDYGKPHLCIETLQGLTIRIYSNSIGISPHNRYGDTTYLNLIPSFNTLRIGDSRETFNDFIILDIESLKKRK